MKNMFDKKRTSIKRVLRIKYLSDRAIFQETFTLTRLLKTVIQYVIKKSKRYVHKKNFYTFIILNFIF